MSREANTLSAKTAGLAITNDVLVVRPNWAGFAKDHEHRIGPVSIGLVLLGVAAKDDNHLVIGLQFIGKVLTFAIIVSAASLGEENPFCHSATRRSKKFLWYLLSASVRPSVNKQKSAPGSREKVMVSNRSESHSATFPRPADGFGTEQVPSASSRNSV